MKTFAEKLGVLVLLTFWGVLIAGVYGALHNQISYTVSSEYFTAFKFQQFGLTNTELPERVRASIIGFLASWWMGFPIGLLIGMIGFIQRGSRRMLTVSLKSTIVAVGFTLLFGLCGLAYGYFETAKLNPFNYSGWYLPPDVVDLRRFLCAGYMHNSAYLGGVLSIFVAWAYQVIVRIRD